MTQGAPGLVAILIAGFAVTYVWRMLGAVAAARVNPEGEIMLLVRAIATALIAALVARIVLQPEGLLAASLAASRYVAILTGVGFYFWQRRVELAVVVAIAVFAGLELAARFLT
ncbi:MAG: AzlD domain-containing protein [Parvibaculaceae bacterium]